MTLRLGNKIIASNGNSSTGGNLEAVWGEIEGDISNQTDLKNSLDSKLNKTNATSKGNTTTPVYFDSSGVAQPITSYSGNANTATQATKAIQDGNGKQINTTYTYKTIGSQGIPSTPTDITRLEMVGKQGCGNGVISGSELVSLHNNTMYKCYERKNATITCSYSDVITSLGNSMCNGTYDGHYTQINPSTSFSSKPFVWEVVSPSRFEVSDVLRLHLYGHRLTDAVNCTAFKIEAYIQDTLDNTKKWVTVYNYSGVSVNIAQTGWGLYVTGYSTSSHYEVFGIRLTISGSPDTIFRLSEIELVASRGTEIPYNSLHCVSDSGGKIWGNLEVTGNITVPTVTTGTNDTKVATTAFVNNSVNVHANNKSNPHGVTKSQVGLSNVDNTSDVNKPISTATQNALNEKVDIDNMVEVDFVDAGSYISGMGMPSSKWVALSLGASDSKYIAPANGYFTIAGESNAGNANITLINGVLRSRCNAATVTGTDCYCFIPAKKGDEVTVQYASFVINQDYMGFWFVYAEGEV